MGAAASNEIQHAKRRTHPTREILSLIHAVEHLGLKITGREVTVGGLSSPVWMTLSISIHGEDAYIQLIKNNDISHGPSHPNSRTVERRRAAVLNRDYIYLEVPALSEREMEARVAVWLLCASKTRQRFINKWPHQHRARSLTRGAV